MIDMKKERDIEEQGDKTDLEFWEEDKRNAMDIVDFSENRERGRMERGLELRKKVIENHTQK